MTASQPVPGNEADRDDPPFSPALVEEMLRQLDKTVRARQLYLANNPAYRQSLDRLRASFAPVWAETESVTLAVTETQFKWSNVVVHDQSTKASDSLPWLFYKDGLREVTLSRGFEDTELEDLIEIVPRVRRAQADEDDLLTLLWELEFQHLTYRKVDLALEGAPALTTAAEPGKYPQDTQGKVDDPAAVSASARAEAAQQQEAAPDRPGVVNLDEFDSTLYFLEQKEVEYITREIEREYASDLRRTVLDALFDIFEVQTDAKVRDEVVQHLEEMVLHLLAAGQFQTVAYLLREVPGISQRATALEPAHGARLAALPTRLSEPSTLAQLLQQLDEAPQLPSQEDLTALFSELQASALETVFEWLDNARNPRLKTMLESAAGRLASANTAELVRLITNAQGAAAMHAVKRAGALKASAAVPALAKVLGDPQKEMRAAAVAALVEIGSPGAMQSLERSLTDADRDVRVAAVRAIGSRAQRSALARVEGVVKSKEIRAADLTERMAFFEAYGQLCGDGGVPFLDGLLHGKSGLLGRKEDPEIRACAAIALGRIKTPRSEQSLQKAMGEKDAVVRNAVNRALKGSAT